MMILPIGKQKAFTLIEVLVTVVIVTVAYVAIAQALIQAMRINHDSDAASDLMIHSEVYLQSSGELPVPIDPDGSLTASGRVFYLTRVKDQRTLADYVFEVRDHNGGVLSSGKITLPGD